MKPLQLMMTAFGPYKAKETIDFEQLKDHRLFVISGATGAGKTTIFDAISFALYGSASGSDRDNITMLRSDFADEDVHTEVELTFELKDRIYRILRRLGHLKSGNKTKTGDKIEFFELIDGVEVPAVERQIISMVDNKLQEIIGLSPDQFKQIVMLPQGEFRKLLTSETENKEAILRRLFKTEKYQKLNDLLKVKRDYLNQQFASEEQMKQHFIQSIHTSLEKRENAPIFRLLENEHYNSLQVIEALTVEVKFYEEKLKLDEIHNKQALKKYERNQTLYHQSIAVNEQFRSLEQKNETLKQYENDEERIKALEIQLVAAERASVIEPYEKQLNEKRIELNKKTTQLEELKTTLSSAEKTALETKLKYDKIAEKQTERDNLARDLEKLTDFLPIVKEIETNRHVLLNDEKALKQQEKEIENMTNVIDSKMKEVEKTKEDMQEIELKTKKLPSKKEEVNTLRTKFSLFRTYRELSLTQVDTKHKLDEKAVIYNKTKKNYEDFESVWLQNQAVILAHELHDGENCPVCGSVDHPNKAKKSSDVVTREILNKVKAEVEQTHKTYLNQLTDFRANEQQLSHFAKEIAEYEVDVEEIPEQLEEISQYGVRLNDEVVAMEKSVVKLEELKKNLEEINEFIKQATSNREQNAQAYQINLTAYTASQATFTERIRKIDAEMQDAKKLEAKMNDVKQQKSVLDKEWEMIQNKLKVAEEVKTKAEVNLSNGEKQLIEIRESLGIIESSFVLELRRANFETEEAYANAKKPLAEIATIKKEIETHNQTVITLKKQIEELTVALTDKRKIDIAELEKEVSANKQISEAAFHQLNKTKKNQETASSIQTNIIKINQQSAELEKQLITVSDLHDVMRGRNDKKLSFERYVQIDYLEQIMGAANERLRDLSNGQYYLIKSDRLESGGRQSGLSIDVYDAYTGQTRDVKTLSGGEKFNASLSLALGMSDVIQSFQGNISIDTMFIDEGFGSLDEESLTKAIDALIDLQKTGRMIGVISHVEELKAIFPATLEVTKTKEGHSHTRFIVK